MFPSNNDNDLPFGADGGPFAGGFGGPPADGIFETLGDGADPFDGLDANDERAGTTKENNFLMAGLHFFEKIKGMG